jgi:hypothetical protein
MEIPRCPVVEHVGSRVVRAGWYGRPRHRRQRWLCVPANGDPRHRFTPVLTRQGEPHAFCVECSTGLEPWEGQAGAREYRFAAREVGEALVAIAKGASDQTAAQAARRHAGRLPEAADDGFERGWRRRDPARDGQLVANWIDVFTGLVCAGERPARWPEVLLIDSKNFRVRTGERAGRGFHVFAAMGCDPGEPGRWAPTPGLWRLEPFPHRDQVAWEAFFRCLDGAPRVIVSDADHALACAIETVFAEARPEHRLCEWHLGRKLREHLPDPILEDHEHPIARALPGAFHTIEAWETLLAAIDAEHAHGEHGPLTIASRWLDTYGDRVRAQIATRDPNQPNATGPVEKVLVEIDRRIGDRVGSFTNRARMTKLLTLIALDLTGRSDAREWADRLRERLYLAGGRPVNQRPHDDPKGTYSLIS